MSLFTSHYFTKSSGYDKKKYQNWRNILWKYMEIEMFIQKSFQPIVRLLWWKKQTETVKSSSKTDYIACQCEIWPRKLSSANNQQTWLCFNKAYNKNKPFSFLAMMRFISYPTYVMSNEAPLAPKFLTYFLAS